MRVSDSERQRTIDELRRHCAAGRLDVDEYSVRLERAMAATTLEELDGLTTDLPMVRIADPAGYRRAAPGGQARAISAAAREWTEGRGSTGIRGRLSATAVVVLSVVVVMTAVLLAVLAGWAWAAVLVVGWLVGLLQGRVTTRRR